MDFLFGGVIYDLGHVLIGLRPVASVGDRFDENRTGLDQLAFKLDTKSEIDAAAVHLDDLASSTSR